MTIKTLRLPTLLTLTTALLTSGLTATEIHAKGNVDQGKAKSKTCAACHNRSIPDSYLIEGENEGYIKSALRAYREQIFVDPAMRSITFFMSDEDIEDIAAYYSRLPRKPIGKEAEQRDQ
ncbi:hypothetical protein HBA55_14625 [Pseudomaricurvus alkylphenolicus]|uniref:c-type cytochrome n=1 Tax=Pseudomaricurvus alkylphenolicus TaxID=1306991 RepID=UPI00141E588D|nr:hypothetical protein [Pseudomaricurvus alkylphenolicus]NIB40833.1 hypothetical protein [Pseudomaricurvus alkylphenolicus]